MAGGGPRREPRPAPDDFVAAVRAVVRAIPPGQVLTYGEVAREAGRPGWARAAGQVLAAGVDGPWWRVVTATGRLAPGLEVEQAARLRAEAVPLRNGRVVMGR